MESIRTWMPFLVRAGLGLLIFIELAVVLVLVIRGFATAAPAPHQPVAFTHVPHVRADGIQCGFCHRGAETGAAAGIPSVEQCMFCHSVIGKGKAEVQKVVAAFESNQPVLWERVYRVPDSVHFTHEPHVRANVGCTTCHGDVGGMERVRQVRILRMGDCLACHRDRGAPTECSTCHY